MSTSTQSTRAGKFSTAMLWLERAVEGWSKWRIMGVYWGIQAGVILLLLVPWIWQAGSVKKSSPFGEVPDPQMLQVFTAWQLWVTWLVIAGVLGVLQGVMLVPVFKPRPRQQRGVPLALSVACSGGLAVVMAFGAAIAVLHLIAEYDVEVPFVGALSLVVSPWVIVGGLVVMGWLVATPLVWAFCTRRLKAGDRYETVLRKLSARLFMGTWIEVLAIIPLDVMIRRRTECYCFAGTWWGMTLATAVGLVVLGPIVILPIVSSRRKRWYAGHCDACGYEVGSLVAGGRELDRCPACGCGWRARCAGCGYDMGSLVAGSRGLSKCPECGLAATEGTQG